MHSVTLVLFLLSHHMLRPRSSRHSHLRPHPRLILHRGPAPQRSTGGDVRSLVGCHLRDTPHCCRVTSVVFITPVLIQHTQDTTYCAPY